MHWALEGCGKCSPTELGVLSFAWLLRMNVFELLGAEVRSFIGFAARRMPRNFIVLLASAALLYFGCAAYVLHFEVERFLFPQMPNFVGTTAEATLSFKSDSGNELLVRRYGEASLGCVVFFPGQHGTSSAYSFSEYSVAGLAVFILAYPGQDGALGRTELSEIEGLVAKALAEIVGACGSSQTVVVGVSLGAMLAAYSVQSTPVAGLVLSSTAPSLSSAIRSRLRSNWALAPLGWLPLSELLPHDYTLTEALMRSPDMHVAIFQGTQDAQTPIEHLRTPVARLRNVQLVPVPGGSHSTTFVSSQSAQLVVIRSMLRLRSKRH